MRAALGWCFFALVAGWCVGWLGGWLFGAELLWDPVTEDVNGQAEEVVESEIEALDLGSGATWTSTFCEISRCQLANLFPWVNGTNYSLRVRVADAAGNWSAWSAGVDWRPRFFLRGDANGDERLDIADAVYSLRVQFLTGVRGGECLDAFDCDDNGTVEIADPVKLLLLMFGGGTEELPAPWPEPGLDGTAGDGLECQ